MNIDELRTLCGQLDRTLERLSSRLVALPWGIRLELRRELRERARPGLVAWRRRTAVLYVLAEESSAVSALGAELLLRYPALNEELEALLLAQAPLRALLEQGPLGASARESFDGLLAQLERQLELLMLGLDLREDATATTVVTTKHETRQRLRA